MDRTGHSSTSSIRLNYTILEAAGLIDVIDSKPYPKGLHEKISATIKEFLKEK